MKSPTKHKIHSPRIGKHTTIVDSTATTNDDVAGKENQNYYVNKANRNSSVNENLNLVVVIDVKSSKSEAS